MYWDAVESALKSHIETGWAGTAYAAVPLVFENDPPSDLAAGATSFVAIVIEGTFSEKGVYGGSGKRLSVEGGIVHYHCFVATGSEKATALARAVAMQAILELQVVSTAIKLDGGNPPSPVDYGDPTVPNDQPGGNLYRCSGSVPFIVIASR